MEEAKAMTHHQQQQQQRQQLMLQQHQQNQQQQQQQQLFLLQQQQQQQAAMSRFPSNIDAHLRPPNLNRQFTLQQQQHQQQQQQQNPNPNLLQQQQQQNPSLNAQQLHLHQQQQQQQKAIRPGNQVELQMAYQDAWRVCHPDFKRPFSSLEDVCERLLPYHVVADYEAEEDDKILDSDSTGQMPSRSQQWDHNIAAKVAECLVTFEKQVLAFNIISRKRSAGEFRCEERLMIEQALLQEEKRAMMELRAEIESREKAKLRMEAMVHAEQARANSHAEMMARAPIRANAIGSQGNNNDASLAHDIAEEEGINQEDGINGWGNNAQQRDEKEPSEDFLNDEETENDDACTQDEWREVGEFDLNTR